MNSRSLLSPLLVAALTVCHVASPSSAVAAQQSPIKTGTVDVGGAQLPYWDTGGDGVPVILLHANTGSLESWPHQQTAFPREGFRTISYSRRGVGSTTRSKEPIAHHVDLARLMDALTIPRAHLVGIAAGGVVAVDFFLSHPDRVSGLVIASSIVSFNEPLILQAQKEYRGPRPGPNGVSQAEMELSKVYRDSNPEGTRVWSEIQRRVEGAGLPPMAQTNNTLEPLAATRLPMLLLGGEFDPFMNPTLVGRMAAKLPNAEHHTIRNAAHAAQWEEPDEFNRLVLAYLRTRTSASGLARFLQADDDVVVVASRPR